MKPYFIILQFRRWINRVICYSKCIVWQHIKWAKLSTGLHLNDKPITFILYSLGSFSCKLARFNDECPLLALQTTSSNRDTNEYFNNDSQLHERQIVNGTILSNIIDVSVHCNRDDNIVYITQLTATYSSGCKLAAIYWSSETLDPILEFRIIFSMLPKGTEDLYENIL